MSRTTFNFHDLAGVQITSSDPGALRFFKDEYRFSGAVLSQDLNMVNLHWRKDLAFRPVRHDFSFHVHKFFARWSYQIELLENRINIHAYGNRTAIPMVHHMLVHPSLRYLCAHSEALMLHGSAVVVNDQSLVFTGSGGTGKTTISSLLLRHGGTDWKLHADDYTFLTKGPKSFSYMTRSHLYRDHLRWVPSIKSVLSPTERLRLAFFGAIRQMSMDGIKWPLRVDANRLWPNHDVAPKADLAGIIILGKERTSTPSLNRINPSEEIVEELLHMNFFEARHFVKLVGKDLEGPAHENWLETWMEKERSTLTQLLHQASLFQLNLPFMDGDKDEFGKELVEILMPIVGGKGSYV